MKADLDGINTDSIKALTEWAVRFRDERDWKGHHTDKNLAANTVVEAAELLEHSGLMKSHSISRGWRMRRPMYCTACCCFVRLLESI